MGVVKWHDMAVASVTVMAASRMEAGALARGTEVAGEIRAGPLSGIPAGMRRGPPPILTNPLIFYYDITATGQV